MLFLDMFLDYNIFLLNSADGQGDESQGGAGEGGENPPSGAAPAAGQRPLAEDRRPDQFYEWAGYFSAGPPGRHSRGPEWRSEPALDKRERAGGRPRPSSDDRLRADRLARFFEPSARKRFHSPGPLPDDPGEMRCFLN